MPNQVRKQSPTSRDSRHYSERRAGQDGTLYREKERDGGAHTLIFIRQRVRPRYSPTFIRLALHQAPVAVVGCLGERMVVE